MPTNFVRSIQAYARSLSNALKSIDDILARMPSGEGATPSSSLLKELETAKAEAKVKFEKLDANTSINKPNCPRTKNRHTQKRMKTLSKTTTRPYRRPTPR